MIAPMERPIISFLTDFGLDGAAAACRGVMLSICREAHIVDICHTVRKFAIRDGAYILRASLPYMPVGVHVAVVDPGVGTERGPNRSWCTTGRHSEPARWARSCCTSTRSATSRWPKIRVMQRTDCGWLPISVHGSRSRNSNAPRHRSGGVRARGRLVVDRWWISRRESADLVDKGARRGHAGHLCSGCPGGAGSTQRLHQWIAKVPSGRFYVPRSTQAR